MKKNIIHGYMIITLSLIFFTSFGSKNSVSEIRESNEDKSSKTAELQKVEETSKSSEDKDDAKKLLARVNGLPIYEEDLRGRPLEYVIQTEILYDEALRRGLDKRYENIINDYKKTLLIREYKNDLTKSIDEDISDEEVKEYYDRNKDSYTNVYVYELSTKDEELTNQLYKRVLAGEDMNKIAYEFEAEEKGKVILKEFYLPNQYKNYLEKLEPGELSNVIKGRNYYLIYKIINVKVKPLKTVHSPITYRIIGEKKAKLIEQFAERIKDEQGIEVEILDKNQ